MGFGLGRAICKFIEFREDQATRYPIPSLVGVVEQLSVAADGDVADRSFISGVSRDLFVSISISSPSVTL